MSELVSVVLKRTFGFWGKLIRRKVAKRFEGGDFTNKECRRLIVRELDDIKSKLDGLARKDLLSSLCFLQEGVNGLYQSLLQSPSDENTPQSVTTVEAAFSRDTSPHSPVNEAIALIKAISSSRIHSNERFKSVLIAGGLKSKFNQTKRNQTLFDFTKKFTKLPARILDWPTIFLGERSYHPMSGGDRVVEKLKESGVEVMSPSPDVTFDESLDPGCSSVNSKGEIVAKILGKDTLKTLNVQGKVTNCAMFQEKRTWEARGRFVRLMSMKKITSTSSLHSKSA